MLEGLAAAISTPDFWATFLGDLANPTLKTDLAQAQADLGAAVQQAQIRTLQMMEDEERRRRAAVQASERSGALVILGLILAAGGVYYVVARKSLGRGSKRRGRV